ncbi:MAG: ATP-dependent DNA helicase RecG [Patescibacteria group bacterium]|jgi:ATP-dependent DNA helicase RecG
MDLNTPLSALGGVGEKIAKRLTILGLQTVSDLLFYFPFRYEDFTQTVKIENLKPGVPANVVGQIDLIQNRRAHRRRMYITEAMINDGTESLKIIWFNQPFIAKTLKIGDTISLAGVAEDQGALTIISPTYEKIYPPHPAGTPPKEGNNYAIHTSGFVPNYHLTQNITQKQLRFLIKQVIALAKNLPNPLPENIQKKLKLLSISEAVELIHFPQKKSEAEDARRRLAFDELFLLQLKSQLAKKERDEAATEPIKFYEKETRDFVASLPFKLTEDQRKASWTILQEMKEKKPMARLLNGDVGSGKTLVAIIALLNASLDKKQSALMAPTEILARQHFQTLTKLLKDWPIKICLLTNSYKLISTRQEEIKKTEILKIIKSGEINIVIGTHAIIQKDVEFKNLSLIIIDEQHRFGVEQRKMLMKKSNKENKTPHLLSMTATPIPRSLALAIFCDLDISLIKQMPIGRKPIMTKLVPEEKRPDAYNFIREQIKNGHQVFVVCPLIEESDSLGVKSVKEEFAKLDQAIFPEIKIVALHGKLKAKEKEEIMNGFLSGEYKILVSTSVIEVGVDVPNATIMMIEGADRFGLAQLHQFRGRVGRGSEQSYCFLFQSSNELEENRRLKIMEQYADGFSLAEMDLKFRGSGEVFGTAQSGWPELKIATLWDYELTRQAQEEAKILIQTDPQLEKNPLLKEKIKNFDKIHLE